MQPWHTPFPTWNQSAVCMCVPGSNLSCVHMNPTLKSTLWTLRTEVWGTVLPQTGRLAT